MRLLLLALSTLLGQPAFEGTRAEGPRARIARLPPGATPPVVDGTVRDEEWELAGRLGALRQVEPVAGADPSERTEVLLLHDPRSLYVALRCFDDDPSGIRATQARRDANLDPDDRVEMLFDPFLDRRNAFWFQIGPAGSKGDALITRNGAVFNKRWDAVWFGRARITEEGWEAEIRIPVASINFDPEARAWGFNLRRFVRRRNEEARWASPVPRVRFFSVADAGTLVGFEGLRQAKGLDLRPFGLLDWNEDASGEGELEPDAGLDLFWRLSPGTKLSLSVNTDFAETEVDERRVNLTRFPLFFPEKRDFFLEDSGIFEFGSGGQDVVPFFSRRIGIGPDGTEVPLLVAAKATGRSEELSWGVLDVQTDDEGDLEAQNLLAARFSRNVLGQSDVGVLATLGDPSGVRDTATAGADLNLRTSSFRGDENLNLEAWVLRTEGEGRAGDGFAWRTRLSYPNDEVDLSAAWTVVEERFDPALGFVRRQGSKRYETSLAWRPRLHTAVRQLDFRVTPLLITDTANDTRTVAIEMQPLEVELESGDEVELTVTRMREVLEEAFDIAPDVTIPRDAYGFTRVGAEVETTEKRPWSVELGWEGGEFFDGHRDDWRAGLDLRLGARAGVDLEYERSDVRLPDGDFVVNVARARVDLQFGPRLAWSSFVQWDDRSERLGAQSRLWWILQPGNELFLVVEQGWDVAQGSFAPAETRATLKVGYTLRL